MDCWARAFARSKRVELPRFPVDFMGVAAGWLARSGVVPHIGPVKQVQMSDEPENIRDDVNNPVADAYKQGVQQHDPPTRPLFAYLLSASDGCLQPLRKERSCHGHLHRF